MNPPPAPALLLTSARLADGRVVDVVIGGGVITAVRAADASSAARRSDGATPVPAALDLAGMMLLPAPAEPHAHLDKALVANRVPNPAEDLAGAIDAIIRAYATMTYDDLTTRSLNAIAIAVARGFTAIRTHLDCRIGIGSRSVRRLAEIKHEVRDLVDIQIVALAGHLTDADGTDNRVLLLESLAAGADLVGGTPSLESDPTAAVAELVAIAAEHGVGIDLHVDETIDRTATALRTLAERVTATGFPYPVTASHCVSLGMQEPDEQRRTAEAVAAAGISVVTLPQTNLYLQSREVQSAKPRGLTAIGALRAAGVTVAGGSDNWRDPFNPMGRIDPMETASLLVTAGHLLVSDAYDAVSAGSRAALGLPAVRVAPGYPADLLAIRGSSLADAIADASERRIVIRAGRVVAETRVTRDVDPRDHVALRRATASAR